MKSETFRASAPLRLDFAGGWTDVAPFAEAERGVVVNAAIELRATAEVTPGRERYVLQSVDLDQTLELSAEELSRYSQLELLKAAVRRSGLGPCGLRTWSEAPPGSGLGSSGALDVAMVAALDRAQGITRGPAELAEEAFHLEAVEAGLPGGRQDQYAAAFGGFLRLEFAGGTVKVERLALDLEFAAALERQTVICYTGLSRVSSRTIERVMSAYRRREPQVVGSLRALADIANQMTDALGAADLDRVAALLSENWSRQQQLDAAMRTEPMARLEAAVQRAGALGGKAAGAGAGGCMFFLVRDPEAAARAAQATGCRLLRTSWTAQGVRIESPAGAAR
ncbi:MAG: GHMP family kinase ATP-binding protein [Gemmatimonadales bacterium]